MSVDVRWYGTARVCCARGTQEKPAAACICGTQSGRRGPLLLSRPREFAVQRGRIADCRVGLLVIDWIRAAGPDSKDGENDDDFDARLAKLTKNKSVPGGRGKSRETPYSVLQDQKNASKSGT